MNKIIKWTLLILAAFICAILAFAFGLMISTEVIKIFSGGKNERAYIDRPSYRRTTTNSVARK